MTSVLNDKPVIGIIAGFTSWVLYFLKELFTDDELLKWIAGVGIWLGVIVALLTVYLRVIEIRKQDR
jgi:hypothetical protein